LRDRPEGGVLEELDTSSVRLAGKEADDGDGDGVLGADPVSDVFSVFDVVCPCEAFFDEPEIVANGVGAEEVVSFGEVLALEGGGQGGFAGFGEVGEGFYVGEEGGHGDKNKFYSMMVYDFIAGIIPLSAGLRERLDSILRVKDFGKKEFLLREGQVCDRIYFVEKGLVRIYYLKDGVEMCSGLLLEGGFMISVESFFRR